MGQVAWGWRSHGSLDPGEWPIVGMGIALPTSRHSIFNIHLSSILSDLAQEKHSMVVDILKRNSLNGSERYPVVCVCLYRRACH
jgi:hypothetical protein